MNGKIIQVGLIIHRKSKIDNQKKMNNNKMHQNRKTKEGIG